MNENINLSIPKTQIGLGMIEKIGEVAKGFAPSKVMIITDAGIVKTGIVNSVITPLKKAGYEPVVWDKCQPEAPLSVIETLAKLVKKEKYDLLIGVGGGSTMDTVKMVSLTAVSGVSVLELKGGKAANNTLPKILVPTTAGTGSEWSNVAVVSDDKSAKHSLTIVVVSPQNLADAVIIDPQLTANLPQRITADTGMDALAHAIESFTCPLSNAVSDMFAETAIRLISQNLRQAYAKGSQYLTARYNLSLAAALAMHAVVQANIGLAHFMNQPLGKKCHVSHGTACTLLLPAVMRFNMIANPAKYARIAEFMGEDTWGLTEREAAEKAVEAVEKLAEDLNMPRRVEMEITEADIQALTDELFELEAMTIKIFNPREVSHAEAAALYRKVLMEL
jgi:alcohol dehydrogenase